MISHSQDYDAVEHVSPKMIGRKVFHIEHIDLGHNTCQIHAIVNYGNNEAKKVIINYIDIPEDFWPVLVEMSKICPIHMVGFEKTV